MADIEKIHGGALLQLLTELHVDKIPLKMQLPDSSEMHLTFIDDIHKRDRMLHFLIDSPESCQILSAETGLSNLRFEFSDKDNIKHIFETNTWQLAGETLRAKFPEWVNRYQRRKLFRLEAPHGTRLYFKTNDIHYKLLVINISLGGTLGVIVRLTRQMEQELKQYDSKMLHNVKLLFPAKDRKKAGTILNIKRCQIKRQEKNPLTNKFQCAMEFKEISEGEQKTLTDLFYRWQRDYLRRKRFLEA